MSILRDGWATHVLDGMDGLLWSGCEKVLSLIESNMQRTTQVCDWLYFTSMWSLSCNMVNFI
jgi:hypothetical protein